MFVIITLLMLFVNLKAPAVSKMAARTAQPFASRR